MKSRVKLRPHDQPQVMLTVPDFGTFRGKGKMKHWHKDILVLITTHNAALQRDLDRTRHSKNICVIKSLIKTYINAKTQGFSLRCSNNASHPLQLFDEGSAQFKYLYTVSYCYSPLHYPRYRLSKVLTSQSSLPEHCPRRDQSVRLWSLVVGETERI